ncbi:MAG: hypothetical protein ACI4DS_01405 [Eubacterium sp.]
MDSKKDWDIFVATGKVEDYLRFAQSRRDEDSNKENKPYSKGKDGTDNINRNSCFCNANR